MGWAVNEEPDSVPADEPMLGIDLPAAPAQAAGPYRVLARKYRPQKFSELIGQDALVQTLSNAIARDRLAHAFLMTGVRGVGKTTTARLIAKGLNCVGIDGQGGPTIDPCGVCDPCVAIAEGRHIDVIEMDAASHTGVDDVREIIEAVRYSAVSARYKIYIIDEVHMLSKNAFNALLKTLEEPPAHVKFLFATTEVNKVPVTVLSRCQRFDLRRITPDLLHGHFAKICQAEGVSIEDEALRLIAAAAEGSARDGLSILDQAIAHSDLGGGQQITAADVRDMLGLADGGIARELMALLLAGEGAPAIDLLRAAYARGMDPLAQIRALMGLAHGIALARISRSDDPAHTPEDRAAIDLWAQSMGMARIQRLWQLLTRAHDEVARAGDALMASEMALLRVVYAGTLPDPDELARLLKEGGSPPPAAQPKAETPEPQAQTPPIAADPLPEPETPSLVSIMSDPEPLSSPIPEAAATADTATIEGLAHALAAGGHHRAASTLRREGRLVELTPGNLTLSAGGAITSETATALAAALASALGEPWTVVLSEAAGAPTLPELSATATAEREAAYRAHPLVDAALRQFPGADYRPPESDAA
jgi:DNA polymerase III subunit gamma/tau